MPQNQTKTNGATSDGKDPHSQRKDLQMTQSGHQMQQEQLRGLLQNPQVIDRLLSPDFEGDSDWVAELVRNELHVDEVLAVLTEDDIWKKRWGARIKAGKYMMSFPAAASRSPDDRVNRVQERMHGVDHQPLTPRQRQDINAKMDQKSDRAMRADDGTFLELLLSQVVKSEEKSAADSGSESRFGSLLGGER